MRRKSIAQVLTSGVLVIALMGSGATSAIADGAGDTAGPGAHFVEAPDAGEIAEAAEVMRADLASMAAADDDVLVVDLGGGDTADNALVVNVAGLSDMEKNLVIEDLEGTLEGEVAIEEATLGEYVEQQVTTAALKELLDPLAQSGGGGLAKAAAPVRTLTCATGDKTYVDQNLSMTVRNNCPYKTVNWGMTINASVRSIIVTNISERGMDWWYNGVKKGRNAPHNVYKTYFFHGTLNPTASPGAVKMDDLMTFQVKVGGKVLPASIYTCMTLNLRK
ncbi:hypothetical protein H9623_18595 [Oerskovia sp. Sa1BUA8]|uniref:Uncharacterized protein n=1 Tax=Oerskovia douganii TaxID=2762210 RepID=A0A9D5UD12_9CELL|nr:hypothetical protein [Oerskovia douganii]MBE7702305.1 hypothetical protein [Oerskovia douganii]